MRKLLSREVIVPACTFTIGVLTSILVADYLHKHDPVLFALAGVLLLLTLLIGLSVRGITSSETALHLIDSRIDHLLARTGLSAEYIEDAESGQSYRRATILIENARESLTFVDMWEPFEDYQTGTPERIQARKDFYTAIINQTERHRSSHDMFHRRIVQVPAEYANTVVPFDLDPYFYAYLKRIVELQATSYETCSIRITPVHVIKAHFIIVDRRYIILPILTTDAITNRQIRHGALFFDDRDGELFRGLRGIYRAIDAHAHPLTIANLTVSNSGNLEKAQKTLDN